MYKNIGDYGIIGNLHSIALIGLDGSIDWLCLPHIDSPSIFAALLDDNKGGSFSVSPRDDWDSLSEYVPDTNILVTKFRTRSGILQLTDFMPIPFGGEEELEEQHHELYRLVEVLKGEVEVRVAFSPRFDYARSKTLLEEDKGAIIAKGKGEAIVLSSTLPLACNQDASVTTWRVTQGTRVWLHLEYGTEEPTEIDPTEAERSLEETKAY